MIAADPQDRVSQLGVTCHSPGIMEGWRVGEGNIIKHIPKTTKIQTKYLKHDEFFKETQESWVAGSSGVAVRPECGIPWGQWNLSCGVCCMGVLAVWYSGELGLPCQPWREQIKHPQLLEDGVYSDSKSEQTKYLHFVYFYFLNWPSPFTNWERFWSRRSVHSEK